MKSENGANRHDYDLFHPAHLVPIDATAAQISQVAQYEEQVRCAYRARIERMLRESDEADAADLVSIAPVDERW